MGNVLPTGMRYRIDNTSLVILPTTARHNNRVLFEQRMDLEGMVSSFQAAAVGDGALRAVNQVLALPGETRVLSVFSVPGSSNRLFSPPVTGALGVIGVGGGASTIVKIKVARLPGIKADKANR